MQSRIVLETKRRISRCSLIFIEGFCPPESTSAVLAGQFQEGGRKFKRHLIAWRLRPRSAAWGKWDESRMQLLFFVDHSTPTRGAFKLLSTPGS